MSKTLLQINSGLFGDHSQSNHLANEFAHKWLASHGDAQVQVRDVTANPLPLLDAALVQALGKQAELRTAQEQAWVDLSDTLIAEIQAADALLLAVPMYNFGVPSQLKAYFDLLARAGVTFKYTAMGPVGLLVDKPVYIIAARGGIHVGQTSDSQSQFLQTFLSFIGLHNQQFIYAEALNMGDDVRQQALLQAGEKIDALAA